MILLFALLCKFLDKPQHLLQIMMCAQAVATMPGPQLLLHIRCCAGQGTHVYALDFLGLLCDVLSCTLACACFTAHGRIGLGKG